MSDMPVRRRIAKAVMEKYGAISEEAGALSKLYRDQAKALTALKEAQSVLYPPDNTIPTVSLIGTPQHMETLIKELEDVRC